MSENVLTNVFIKCLVHIILFKIFHTIILFVVQLLPAPRVNNGAAEPRRDSANEQSVQKIESTNSSINNGLTIPSSDVCLPMTAYGLIGKFVPEILYGATSILAVALKKENWPEILVGILAKPLVSAATMVTELTEKPDLETAVMEFRWLFYIRQCSTNNFEPFAVRVMNEPQIIRKGAV